MADTKISAETNLASIVGTEEFVVNDSGANKKVTANTLLAGAYRQSIQSKTIATGTLALTTLTGSPPTIYLLTVDTESAAATDDLDTVTGGNEGDILYIHGTDAARDVTIKHNATGTGQFFLDGSADRTLTTNQMTAHFIYFLSAWHEAPRKT